MVVELNDAQTLQTIIRNQIREIEEIADLNNLLDNIPNDINLIPTLEEFNRNQGDSHINRVSGSFDSLPTI